MRRNLSAHTYKYHCTYIYSAETYRNLLLINKNLLIFLKFFLKNKKTKIIKQKVNVFNQKVETQRINRFFIPGNVFALRDKLNICICICVCVPTSRSPASALNTST